MTSQIRFGPIANEWIFDTCSRTYDLTRGRSGANDNLKFAATKGPSDILVVVSPSITALVIIDMQNYFLHPLLGHNPLGILAAKKTEELVKNCREVGIKIIWLGWSLTENDLSLLPATLFHSFRDGLEHPPTSPNELRSSFGCNLGQGMGRALMAGSWNAEFYEPLLKSQDRLADVFVAKNRVSGLWNDQTELAHALDQMNVKTLLFAGVNTNQCVLGTLLDAHYRGYDTIMVEDCCATTTPGGQEVTLLDVSQTYGFVTTGAAFRVGKAL